MVSSTRVAVVSDHLDTIFCQHKIEDTKQQFMKHTTSKCYTEEVID